ncbi:MAG: hypothetical protein AAF337_02925 [Pseudomonadota bacterium]
MTKAGFIRLAGQSMTLSALNVALFALFLIALTHIVTPEERGVLGAAYAIAWMSSVFFAPGVSARWAVHAAVSIGSLLWAIPAAACGAVFALVLALPGAASTPYLIAAFALVAGLSVVNDALLRRLNYLGNIMLSQGLGLYYPAFLALATLGFAGLSHSGLSVGISVYLIATGLTAAVVVMHYARGRQHGDRPATREAVVDWPRWAAQTSFLALKNMHALLLVAGMSQASYGVFLVALGCLSPLNAVYGFLSRYIFSQAHFDVSQSAFVRLCIGLASVSCCLVMAIWACVPLLRWAISLLIPASYVPAQLPLVPAASYLAASASFMVLNDIAVRYRPSLRYITCIGCVLLAGAALLIRYPVPWALTGVSAAAGVAAMAALLFDMSGERAHAA